MVDIEANEWYSNKELFEMLTEISEQMQALNKEMVKTTTLLRDYNGVREKIDKVEAAVAQLQARDYNGVINRLNAIETENACYRGARQSNRDYVGWIFAVIMALIAVLTYLSG